MAAQVLFVIGPSALAQNCVSPESTAWIALCVETSLILDVARFHEQRP